MISILKVQSLRVLLKFFEGVELKWQHHMRMVQRPSQTTSVQMEQTYTIQLKWRHIWPIRIHHNKACYPSSVQNQPLTYTRNAMTPNKCLRFRKRIKSIGTCIPNNSFQIRSQTKNQAVQRKTWKLNDHWQIWGSPLHQKERM